jgi:hypothetical protein
MRYYCIQKKTYGKKKPINKSIAHEPSIAASCSNF